jgi:hypothetical protein
MKKVMLSASSYDAASIVHTKSENHKGIGMSYILKASFCMKKVTLPASSYDAAASIVHTKSGNHKGIGMVYFLEGEFLYEKRDAVSVRG